MRWKPEKIKALRVAYGESQRDFSRRLGVTETSLAHWEQGRGNPTGSAQMLLDRLEEDQQQGRIRELRPVAV